MPDTDWWCVLWPDPAAVISTLKVQPGMDAIDLCCGNGYFTAPLARRVAPGRVIGLDLDTNLLAQARDTCRGYHGCTWVEADAMLLSQLIREPVDYVLMANTFHGVPKPTDLASEVAAVLKSGGLFTVVNWYPLRREQTEVLGQPRGPRTEIRMAPEQVRLVVEPGGLMIEAIVDLPPYHYGAIFRKT